jgi:tetratricopeptide (TPR) repeat protein
MTHTTIRRLLLLLLFLPIAHAHASSGPALFQKGRKAFKKGQYYQAVQLLTKASKQLPHWGIIHLELARAMRFNGDPASAIARHVNAAAKAIPRNPRVHQFAGEFWESLGQNKKALSHYQKAIKLGYYAPTPCLRSARILLSQNNPQQALPCLRALLKRRQRPPQAHFLLAQAYTLTKQPIKAGTHWMKAYQYRPNSIVLLQRVFLFYKQHIPKRNPELKRVWLKSLRMLQARLRKMLPKEKKRRLRPLLPSSR